MHETNSLPTSFCEGTKQKTQSKLTENVKNAWH